MLTIDAKRVVIVIVAVLSLSLLVGCAGYVYAPKQGVGWYHRELPEADKAVQDARKTGKKERCPLEFNAAETQMEAAYRTYLSCQTRKGIEMAKEATAMAKALCPPPPDCTLTASPNEIMKGDSSTLTFATSGTVKSALLEGKEVPITGATKTVSPTATTTYSAQCFGIGEHKDVTATVTVTSPPPPPPAPKVIDRLTIYVNFNFDKSDIRKADVPELKKAIDFVKKSRGSKVRLEGHTDSKGTEEYNQKLSESRAEAVKEYLIKEGAVDRAMISAKGYGESRPIAPNETKDGKDNPAGRAENRRVEVLIISE